MKPSTYLLSLWVLWAFDDYKQHSSDSRARANKNSFMANKYISRERKRSQLLSRAHTFGAFPSPIFNYQARFLPGNKSPPEHPSKKHLRLFPFKIPPRYSETADPSPNHPRLHSFKNQQQRERMRPKGEKGICAPGTCVSDTKMHLCWCDTPHAFTLTVVATLGIGKIGNFFHEIGII